MDSSKLTKAELAFLASQGLSVGDVLDATGLTKQEWRDQAKAAGKILVYGARCSAKGHRLRTRSGGHCAECDPSKIAYSNRHSDPGILYVAVSESSGIMKIGSTSNREDRQRQLRSIRYGGQSDWLIIASARVTAKGASELFATQKLAQWKVTGSYQGGHRCDQEAQEMFDAPAAKVLEAFAASVAAHGGTDRWKDDRAFRRLALRNRTA